MLLVFVFGSSESLATAYGISVTGAMVVDTFLAYEFVRVRWRWPLYLAIATLLPLLMLEMIFFGANMLKIHDGGYVPVLIAAAIIVIMWTWRRGTKILHDKTRHTDIPLASFVKSIERKSEHARSPCRERRSFSPAIRNRRRPRCCTTSSTITYCTRRTSS